MPVTPAQSKPYLPAAHAGQVPNPCVITPALLKTHSITPAEYESLHAKLGRTPSLTELGIFSVMWSEHCSYKSSRVHLKRLPTQGNRTEGPGSVVQGPGENAGIIDVGDGWACAFKIESHNHPSYIEPYQGAATGVGGILRDIFTMNARPMAIMDSLRFGPLTPPDDLSSFDEAGGPASPEAPHKPTDQTDYARNRHTMTGVVHGVSGYGNCFGVPNLGGETRFESCYSGNPLLNAFALGLVRKDEIFYAKATGVGNPVIYVGAKTGRDGIHGATMASEEFTEGSEQKRPNVQMGDPFLEKLLLEACLEAMATGAVLGIQDMGAAGLTCSTCEMGARGELGVSIELDLVPQRETGMSSYEIMLSESQERMLLVAAAGREQEVLDIFVKWNLDASIVGEVTADDTMRVFHHGELIAEIPNKALTDEAPVYHRPVGTWTPPVPKDPPAWVLEELKKPRDYTADLKKLLASPNICSKHWIYDQYDSMVQTNTVQGPGGEAGVIRIKGTGHSASKELSSFRNAGGPASPGAAPNLPGAPPSAVPSPKVGGSATDATPDFLGSAAIASPAEGLDPLAVQHSILGKIANFIAQSTPEAEAIHLTGNEDAANPVLAPTADHTTGEPGSAATPPLTPEPYAQIPAKPQRGLAMALAGNGRWCYLDPKLGAMHAVAEAARKVACTGATPVAATNCLNFGNPEKPEIMAQLSEAIDGIAEACRALGTPVTGGNVSLYNETRGEGIYPTPVIGIVGILDDVTKVVPSSFQNPGDEIYLLVPVLLKHKQEWLGQFGSSAYAQSIFQTMWGVPPSIDEHNMKSARQQNEFVAKLADQRKIRSARDISDGGLAVALAKGCYEFGLGVRVNIENICAVGELDAYFSEFPWILFSCAPGTTLVEKPSLAKISSDLSRWAVSSQKMGKDYSGVIEVSIGTVTTGDFLLSYEGKRILDTTTSKLHPHYSKSFESHLAAEVLV